MATNLKTDYKDYIPPESGKPLVQFNTSPADSQVIFAQKNGNLILITKKHLFRAVCPQLMNTYYVKLYPRYYVPMFVNWDSI